MAGLLSIALLIGWFFVAFLITRQATSGLKIGLARFGLMIPLFAVLMVLPVADELVGGFQFRALCREKAVLKIDAEKIRGKTIWMASDPTNKDVGHTAVRIYYTRVSYRDVTTQVELASNGYVVAMGGMLIRTLAGGQETTPMTIFPSTCSGPGNLPTSEKYGFKIETKTQGITQ